MAKTYTENKRLIQPLYQRYRNIFRGSRDSKKENLEMNKILIDLHRLDDKADALIAKSYSDIIRMNRDEIQSWTMMGITAGITGDTWGAELFVDNLTDERAELSRNFVNDRERISYARPRTMGMRLTYNF